ncbi:hypothetical protein RhiJN_16210 [Ceratobasidium sp. AG-Ba]|nr:hypothetical protein RhiJN_16210 [Ceratobasidium sp. AG-Ba]
MLQDDLDVDDTPVCHAVDGHPLVDTDIANDSSSSPDDSPCNHRVKKRPVTGWNAFGPTSNTRTLTSMETSEGSESSMNVDPNTSTRVVNMDAYLESIHEGCQTMAFNQSQAPYTPNLPQNPHLSATTILGLGTFVERPGGDIFVPQNQPNTWDPGSYALGTMQLPGTCGSERTLTQNLGQDTPTPASHSNMSHAPMSYDTPHTMPAALAYQDRFSVSSNTAMASPGTILSHAPSTSSRLVYGEASGAAAQLPAGHMLAAGSVQSKTADKWQEAEEQKLIDFWLQQDGQPMRLDVALSTNRTPHSDTPLAPEWNELREVHFNNSRTSPAIVVHSWGLFKLYFSMVAFLESIHADLSLDDPFPPTIQSSRGWYAKMRARNVKGRYDALRPRATAARSDLSSNQGRRPRPTRARTSKTSLSGSSFGRPNFVVSATPPPVPGTVNSGVSSPISSQYQPSMLSQETSAGSAPAPKATTKAEIHRLSGKVAGYETQVMGAAAGLIVAATKAEQQDSEIQQADKLMSIFERVHDAHLKQVTAARGSLREFLDAEPDKASPSYKAVLDKWLALHEHYKPSDFHMLLLEAISIFRGRVTEDK